MPACSAPICFQGVGTQHLVQAEPWKTEQAPRHSHQKTCFLSGKAIKLCSVKRSREGPGQTSSHGKERRLLLILKTAPRKGAIGHVGLGPGQRYLSLHRCPGRMQSPALRPELSRKRPNLPNGKAMGLSPEQRNIQRQKSKNRKHDM